MAGETLAVDVRIDEAAARGADHVSTTEIDGESVLLGLVRSDGHGDGS